MKKNFTTILLGAAVLALFAGCAKEPANGVETSSAKVFTASIEGSATKTTIDRTTAGAKICWVTNDVIVVNQPGLQYKATPCANPTCAIFAPEGDEAEPIDGKYYAWYPYNLVQDVEGEPVMVLNNKALYKGNNLNNMFPMYAESETTEFVFKNICGLLEITLKGTKMVDRIEVKDADKALSGVITLDEDFNAVIEDPTTKASITLLCENTKLTEDGVAFYLPVPPATYNKLTVTVYSADGFSWSIDAAKAATVERNKIYPLAFTPDLGTDAHEVVQLWEDGPYWSTTNIGATSPTDPGLYFAWAELTGYRLVQFEDAAQNYYIGEYPYRDFSHETEYKHALDFSTLELTGKDINLDAARAIWGDGWRLPTSAEIEALAALEPTVEAVLDGEETVGFKYTTAKGSIVFAKSGIFNKAAPSGGIGSSGNGYIWTSTKYNPEASHDVYRADIKSTGISIKGSGVREYWGIPVRPVRDTPLAK